MKNKLPLIVRLPDVYFVLKGKFDCKRGGEECASRFIAKLVDLSYSVQNQMIIDYNNQVKEVIEKSNETIVIYEETKDYLSKQEANSSKKSDLQKLTTQNLNKYISDSKIVLSHSITDLKHAQLNYAANVERIRSIVKSKGQAYMLGANMSKPGYKVDIKFEPIEEYNLDLIERIAKLLNNKGELMYE